MPFHKKTFKKVKSTARRTVRSVSRFSKSSGTSASKFVSRRAKSGVRSVKRSVRSFRRSKSVRDVSKLARKVDPISGFRKLTGALRNPGRVSAKARRRPRRR